MKRLFISDLHLHEQRPRITEAFLHFLEDTATQADELYILGDLFDSWIGDDDDSLLISTIKKGLLSLRQKGVHIFFMVGNRDFLIGEVFARDTQITLLTDPHILNTGFGKMLLMHGDTLCTDDHAYQAFRRHVRSNKWKTQVLSQPLHDRHLLASELREKSKRANNGKDEQIMDVNSTAVVEALQKYQAKLLIHGHTHRPASHKLHMDENEATRLVLGDWNDHQGWYILCEEGEEPKLISFRFQPTKGSKLF